MGQAADPVDGRADLRLAGQVPPPEQGPREERPVVGIVHQAGHDPVDVSPASPLRCGRRIPLSRCSLNRPYGTVTEIRPGSLFGNTTVGAPAVASGRRSAPSLNPLAPTSWGVGAWSVGRGGLGAWGVAESKGANHVSRGAGKWVDPSARSADSSARWR